MGRKKRKNIDIDKPSDTAEKTRVDASTAITAPVPPVKRLKDEQQPEPSFSTTIPTSPRLNQVVEDADDDFENLYEGTGIGSRVMVADETEEDRVESILELTGDQDKLSSGYSIHATSGEYEPLDIYVSDGSEDEEDFEIVLTNSRLGVMRRGGLIPVMQNKQWVRGSALPSDTGYKAEQMEEDTELDPTVKAARELADKRRQLELAKEESRRQESEENAGRDPCLFSKRTAFDIRMDQIEDKPWERGDITDFFNYGLQEENWNEYADIQLAVRQGKPIHIDHIYLKAYF